MKTKLIVLLVLLTLAGGVQAQPYLAASTGTAHIEATGYGSQSRRRDAVAVGQGLTDLIAVVKRENTVGPTGKGEHSV